MKRAKGSWWCAQAQKVLNRMRADKDLYALALAFAQADTYVAPYTWTILIHGYPISCMDKTVIYGYIQIFCIV